MNSTTLIPVSCNRDCGAGCPLAVRMVDGRPERIIDNPDRPDKGLRGCARGFRALDLALSGDRLTVPLKRTGPRGSGEFRPVTWEQALDEAAEALSGLKTRYGTQALLTLAGSGSCRGAVHATGGLTHRFFSLWGQVTTTRGYYSNTAADFAAHSVFGTKYVGSDPGTYRFSRLIVLWGANISDLRFGSGLESVLLERKKAGVPIVVIDPRRTRTVQRLAGGTRTDGEDGVSSWLPVYPGSDGALLEAILFVLDEENLIDREFIGKYTYGFGELLGRVRGETGEPPRTPECAGPLCGLSPREIRAFARLLGRTKPAAVLPGLSIQRTLGGEENYRLVMALQAACGNIGIPGGTSGGCPYNTIPTPRKGSPGASGEGLPAPGFRPLQMPVNQWQDAVLEGTAGGFPSDIRGIYGAGHNYVSQASHREKSVRAFESVDFAVCHDLFLTDTARYCDLVLPATHYLEREDILTPSENYLYYSHKVLEPPGEARDDYDIYLALAERLGFGGAFGEGRTSGEWLDWCLKHSDVPDIPRFKSTGIFDGGRHDRVAFADFTAHPEASPLGTPSGKIHFLSGENARAGLPEAPHFRTEALQLSESRDFPLRMVTPHARHRVNSQNANIPWSSRQEPPVLWMHPLDAAARGLAEGVPVRVFNGQGESRLPLRLTGDLKPGVVWMLQGNWGAEASANNLTSTESTLPSFGSRTHSIRVDVAPV